MAEETYAYPTVGDTFTSKAMTGKFTVKRVTPNIITYSSDKGVYSTKPVVFNERIKRKYYTGYSGIYSNTPWWRTEPTLTSPAQQKINEFREGKWYFKINPQEELDVSKLQTALNIIYPEMHYALGTATYYYNDSFPANPGWRASDSEDVKKRLVKEGYKRLDLYTFLYEYYKEYNFGLGDRIQFPSAEEEYVIVGKKGENFEVKDFRTDRPYFWSKKALVRDLALGKTQLLFNNQSINQNGKTKCIFEETTRKEQRAAKPEGKGFHRKRVTYTSGSRPTGSQKTTFTRRTEFRKSSYKGRGIQPHDRH